ncbi:hypothetical protein B0O99DRAFT_677825 [Bisporella sp. PMI_857]|nr:hypothetical protein B0O99DRAFT_677825 [Bisporella sp. PMI_857]
MVGNENQRLEKGDWVPYIAHDNGSQPTYSNSPHLQRAIRVKAEDIPIPSIEDAPSCGPPHFFFVLPKLHAIRLLSGHLLDRADNGNPASPPVTNFPCVVFASVGAMNIGIGIGAFVLVCISKKMRVVSNISNAVFVIVSAIGFGTAMGACNLLKQKSVLENDLWQWACNKEHAGDTDPDFGSIWMCEEMLLKV